MANKFKSNLTASNKSIKANRAELIAEDAQHAQQKLIDKLTDEQRALKRKRIALSDLYPDSELSLRVTKDNFDADKWALELQDIEVQLLNKKVEIKAAEATFNEWFKEDDTEESLSK